MAGVSQQLGNSVGGNGARVKVALSQFASQQLQLIGLGLRFHAFGDYPQTEVMGQADYDAHHLPACWVTLHLGNKAAVNFEGIHRKALQTAE